MTWNSALGRRLARLPGRCTACGGHLATQGHHGHCPLGPRAIVTLDGAGRPILRPVPAAEKADAGVCGAHDGAWRTDLRRQAPDDMPGLWRLPVRERWRPQRAVPA